MLLVAEAIDLLQLLDHLATVDAALSVRNRLFALLFIEFSQYLGLVDLSRNEVYHVELAAWASIDFGVLNLGPLRTFLLNLGHRLLDLWWWPLLAFRLGIIDFWFIFCRVDGEKHIADIVAAAKLLPDVTIDVLVRILLILGLNRLWKLFLVAHLVRQLVMIKVLLPEVLLELLLDATLLRVHRVRHEASLLRDVLVLT
jgi:hypothetical protein